MSVVRAWNSLKARSSHHSLACVVLPSYTHARACMYVIVCTATDRTTWESGHRPWCLEAPPRGTSSSPPMSRSGSRFSSGRGWPARRAPRRGAERRWEETVHSKRAIQRNYVIKNQLFTCMCSPPACLKTRFGFVSGSGEGWSRNCF